MKIQQMALFLGAALFVLVGLAACQSEGAAFKHFAKAPINGIVYDFAKAFGGNN